MKSRSESKGHRVFQDIAFIGGMFLTLLSGGVGTILVLEHTHEIHLALLWAAAMIGGSCLLWRNA